MPCFFDPFTGTIGCTSAGGVGPPSGSGGSGACDPTFIPIPEQWIVYVGPGQLPCRPVQNIQTAPWGGTLAGGASIAGPFCTAQDAQSWITANPNACPSPNGTGGPGGPGGNGVCPTCPACGNDPCSCKKKCYRSKNTGFLYWLGPNEEVGDWLEPCGTIAETTPPEVVANEPAPQPETPQPLTCLIAYAWGSPDWCKCAELWRIEMADLGQLLATLIDRESCTAIDPPDNVFCKALQAIELPLSPDGTKAADLVPYWLTSVRRISKHIDATYGAMQYEMLGVYLLKAAVDTVESAIIAGGFNAKVVTNAELGVNLFGTGLGAGGTYERHASFEAGLKFHLDKVKTVLDQLLQYFVPVGILGTGEAISLYASGQIDLPQLQCMFQAAGYHSGWAQPLAIAARNRPTAYEWIAAWRRGKISDDQLQAAARSIGFIVPGEFDIFTTITQVLPPPSDLVRFMLRSIGDPQVVQQFQLEDEFDILFQGRIKEWAKADGVSESVLRGYHAAHWVVPGPGDLATFWQRFNTARNSPQANALPNKLTQANYDRALREQGIAPYWRPFFQAAQFIVPGQRQIQYAYQYGQFSDDQLSDLYLDAGFRPEHTPAMVAVTKQRAIKFWTADPVAKAYVSTGINEKGLRDYLADSGVSNSTIDSVVSQLKREATEKANESVVKLLEKQFELGAIDDNELVDQLQLLGLDPDQIDRIVVQLKSQKQARAKELPAAELCKMYGSRLISRDEFGARLIRLRYTVYDAELIIAQCERDLTAKQLKAEQLALKSIAASERRQIKDLSYQQRQAQLQKDRAAKALAAQIKAQRQAASALIREEAQIKAATERAVAKAERTAAIAERQELQVLGLIEHIADTWAKKTGENPSTVANQLPPVITSATADGNITVLELLEGMARLVAAPLADLPAQLPDLAALAALQVEVATAIPGEQPANGSPLASVPVSTSPIRTFSPQPVQLPPKQL